MIRHDRRRYMLMNFRVMAAAAGAVVVVAACSDDRTSSFEPVGGAGYIFRSNAANARNMPSFTISYETLDTTAAGPPPTTVSSPRVVVTISNLKQLLPGRAYRVWLVDSSGTVFRLARGQVIRTQVDTVSGLVTTTVDSSFTGLLQLSGGGRANVTYKLRLRRGLLGGTIRTDSAPYSQVVVSIGDSTDSDTTSGGTARPLGRRIRNNGTATATVTGSTTLGNWDVVTVANSYAFAPPFTGTGLGHFRQDEVTADFTELRRPPQGYAYRVYLVKNDSSSVLVSGLTAPYPRRSTSLDGADSSLVDEVVTPDGRIRSSNARNFAAQMNQDVTEFAYVVRVYLTLEPKLSDLTVRGPSLVNSANAPGVLGSVYAEP
jgi:hypothetical protein